MKEKLIIKNFGPIKSVELDLGRFNILIGEQATGKSTVAKVLAVCRYFSYIVWDDGTNNFISSAFNDVLDVWGLSDYNSHSSRVKRDSYIQYTCRHYSVTIKYIEKKIDDWVQTDSDGNGEAIERNVLGFVPELIPISKEFTDLLNEYNDLIKQPGSKVPISFFQKRVSKFMDNPFYLPTERSLQSLFSLGQASIPNFANFLYTYFVRFDDIARVFNNETSIDSLGLIYINESGKGYIRKQSDKNFYSLRLAASGYQSTIPIVLVIKYYNEKRSKAKTFIIEEPELNIFPVAQTQLMQYLVESVNKYGNSFFVNTHSPYIITALNNMIFAHQIGQIDKEKAAGIIAEKYWINHEDVSAYIMKADGTAENIMDDEVMQIKGERIDEISKQLNKEYDQLLDIKYPVHHEG